MITQNELIINTLYTLSFEKIKCSFILYDDKQYPYLSGKAILDKNRDDILTESDFISCNVNLKHKNILETLSKDYINRFYKCILTDFNMKYIKPELSDNIIQILFYEVRPNSNLELTMNCDSTIIKTQLETFYNDKGKRFELEML